jgi:hypothetical protein
MLCCLNNFFCSTPPPVLTDFSYYILMNNFSDLRRTLKEVVVLVAAILQFENMTVLASEFYWYIYCNSAARVNKGHCNSTTRLQFINTPLFARAFYWNINHNISGQAKKRHYSIYNLCSSTSYLHFTIFKILLR